MSLLVFKAISENPRESLSRRALATSIHNELSQIFDSLQINDIPEINILDSQEEDSVQKALKLLSQFDLEEIKDFIEKITVKATILQLHTNEYKIYLDSLFLPLLKAKLYNDEFNVSVTESFKGGDLSSRATLFLARAGIVKLKQLLNLTFPELLAIYNNNYAASSSANKISDALQLKGMRLLNSYERRLTKLDALGTKGASLCICAGILTQEELWEKQYSGAQLQKNLAQYIVHRKRYLDLKFQQIPIVKSWINENEH